MTPEQFEAFLELFRLSLYTAWAVIGWRVALFAVSVYVTRQQQAPLRDFIAAARKREVHKEDSAGIGFVNPAESR